MKDKNSAAATCFLTSLAAILLCWAAVSSMDYQDEQIQQNHYCEMVYLWNDHAHLPKEDRPGWPPYNGEEQCHED